MRRLRQAMVVGMSALLAGGCGGANKSDSQQITDTIKGYYAAAADGDGGKVCSLLATGTRSQLEKQAGGKKCDTAVTAALAQPAYRKLAPTLKSAQVTKVTVNGNAATATVKTKIRQLSVPLQKEHGTWKIQAPLGG